MPRLLIERLSYGPDAIARLEDGRTAFVSGACPGDVVEAKITADHGRYVNAEVTSLVQPSPERVEAPCPYFGVCGGCQWQHVTQAAQLAAKRQSVVDALQRIGHIADAERLVGDTVASDAYGYRNKVELVAEHRGGRLVLGYHRSGSDELVPVDRCLLLPKRFEKAPKALTGALRYVVGSTDLGIARVGLRVARRTKDIEVALWTPPSSFPRQAAAKTLGQALPLSSLVRVLYKGAPKERSVSKVEVLSGRGAWSERLGDYAYTVSAPSFFQTNTKMAEKLVELVLGILESDGSDVVLDLYSGAGTFTLPLADLAGEVIAVEAYGPAVRDLRRNLESAQSWAEVVGGDAAREITDLGYADLVVVDPPRAGLDSAVIDALGRLQPRALAYVSCDPATLARDAKLLAQAGLELVSATPVDLFPQTFHVETVAHFAPRA